MDSSSQELIFSVRMQDEATGPSEIIATGLKAMFTSLEASIVNLGVVFREAIQGINVASASLGSATAAAATAMETSLGGVAATADAEADRIVVSQNKIQQAIQRTLQIQRNEERLGRDTHGGKENVEKEIAAIRSMKDPKYFEELAKAQRGRLVEQSVDLVGKRHQDSVSRGSDAAWKEAEADRLAVSKKRHEEERARQLEEAHWQAEEARREKEISAEKKAGVAEAREELARIDATQKAIDAETLAAAREKLATEKLREQVIRRIFQIQKNDEKLDGGFLSDATRITNEANTAYGLSKGQLEASAYNQKRVLIQQGINLVAKRHRDQETAKQEKETQKVGRKLQTDSRGVAIAQREAEILAGRNKLLQEGLTLKRKINTVGELGFNITTRDANEQKNIANIQRQQLNALALEREEQDGILSVEKQRNALKKAELGIARTEKTRTGRVSPGLRGRLEAIHNLPDDQLADEKRSQRRRQQFENLRLLEDGRYKEPDKPKLSGEAPDKTGAKAALEAVQDLKTAYQDKYKVVISTTQALELMQAREIDAGVAGKKAHDIIHEAGTKSLRQLNTLNSVLNKIAGEMRQLGGIAVGAFTGFLASTMDLIENMRTLSDETNITYVQAQQLIGALGEYGASAGQAERGLKILAKSVEESAEGAGTARDKFSALGISQDTLASKNGNLVEIMKLVADHTSKIGNAAERTTRLSDLLGRGAVSLIPLMMNGGKAIEEMMGKVPAMLPEEANALNQMDVGIKQFINRLRLMAAEVVVSMKPAIDIVLRLGEGIAKFVAGVSTGLGGIIPDLVLLGGTFVLITGFVIPMVSNLVIATSVIGLWGTAARAAAIETGELNGALALLAANPWLVGVALAVTLAGGLAIAMSNEAMETEKLADSYKSAADRMKQLNEQRGKFGGGSTTGNATEDLKAFMRVRKEINDQIAELDSHDSDGNLGKAAAKAKGSREEEAFGYGPETVDKYRDLLKQKVETDAAIEDRLKDKEADAKKNAENAEFEGHKKTTEALKEEVEAIKTRITSGEALTNQELYEAEVEMKAAIAKESLTAKERVAEEKKASETVTRLRTEMYSKNAQLANEEITTSRNAFSAKLADHQVMTVQEVKDEIDAEMRILASKEVSSAKQLEIASKLLKDLVNLRNQFLRQQREDDLAAIKATLQAEEDAISETEAKRKQALEAVRGDKLLAFVKEELAITQEIAAGRMAMGDEERRLFELAQAKHQLEIDTAKQDAAISATSYADKKKNHDKEVAYLEAKLQSAQSRLSKMSGGKATGQLAADPYASEATPLAKFLADSGSQDKAAKERLKKHQEYLKAKADMDAEAIAHGDNAAEVSSQKKEVENLAHLLSVARKKASTNEGSSSKADNDAQQKITSEAQAMIKEEYEYRKKTIDGFSEALLGMKKTEHEMADDRISMAQDSAEAEIMAYEKSTEAALNKAKAIEDTATREQAIQSVITTALQTETDMRIKLVEKVREAYETEFDKIFDLMKELGEFSKSSLEPIKKMMEDRLVSVANTRGIDSEEFMHLLTPYKKVMDEMGKLGKKDSFTDFDLGSIWGTNGEKHKSGGKFTLGSGFSEESKGTGGMLDDLKTRLHSVTEGGLPGKLKELASQFTSSSQDGLAGSANKLRGSFSDLSTMVAKLTANMNGLVSRLNGGGANMSSVPATNPPIVIQQQQTAKPSTATPTPGPNHGTGEYTDMHFGVDQYGRRELVGNPDTSHQAAPIVQGPTPYGYQPRSPHAEQPKLHSNAGSTTIHATVNIGKETYTPTLSVKQGVKHIIDTAVATTGVNMSTGNLNIID